MLLFASMFVKQTALNNHPRTFSPSCGKCYDNILSILPISGEKISVYSQFSV
jgi:hypothetical protein